MTPAVVVVSGLPAAGKTTLATRIACDVGFVLVCRDQLRQAMGPALAESAQGVIGAAMDRLVNHILASVLDAGCGAVVDSNFNWVQQADAVRTLVAERSPPCFEVCLWADADELRRRFAVRADPPLTGDLVPVLERALARPRVPVLGPPTPTFELDTTDIGEVDRTYDALVAQIRAHFSR